MKELRTELNDSVDADNIKEWEAKKEQAVEDLQVTVNKADKFIEQVKEVRNQNSEKAVHHDLQKPTR